MKYIQQSLLSIGVLLSGCSVNSSCEPQDRIKQSIEKEYAEVIVVFQKGVTREEAEKDIASKNMRVLTYYQTISKRTQKPMFHLASDFPLEQTLQVLQADPLIYSASANHEQHLYKER